MHEIHACMTFFYISLASSSETFGFRCYAFFIFISSVLLYAKAEKNFSKLFDVGQPELRRKVKEREEKQRRKVRGEEERSHGREKKRGRRG